MAQGTRGRWIRAATTGFGMVLCTGLVGCMNWDKPKDTKATKQATPRPSASGSRRPAATRSASPTTSPSPTGTATPSPDDCDSTP